MSNPLAGPYLAFDTETTGVDVENDRTVTATTAMLTPALGALWRQDITTWLIAVDIDIAEAATAIHGITTEHARANGKPAGEVLDVVADALADAFKAHIPVVGANLAFDLTMLDRELRRNGLPTITERGALLRPVLDVQVLDKYVDPYRRGSRKLVDLAEHYGCQINGAHDATQDALAAARIAYRMMLLSQVDPVGEAPKGTAPVYGRLKDRDVAGRYRALGTYTLDELHDKQVTWRDLQQASLATYFRKKGNTAEAEAVRTQWPMIPYPAVEKATWED